MAAQRAILAFVAALLILTPACSATFGKVMFLAAQDGPLSCPSGNQRFVANINGEQRSARALRPRPQAAGQSSQPSSHIPWSGWRAHWCTSPFSSCSPELGPGLQAGHLPGSRAPAAYEGHV